MPLYLGAAQEMWNTEPPLSLCQRCVLAPSARSPSGAGPDMSDYNCNDLAADSRNNPFFPKKTCRERATYKSRNPPAIRKRRKEGPCIAGKFPGFYAVTLHTFHMNTAVSVLSKQFCFQERRRELKMNWIKGYKKPAQPVPCQWRSRNELCLCTGFQTWNEPALSNKIELPFIKTQSLVFGCQVWQKPGSSLSEQWETISVIK